MSSVPHPYWLDTVAEEEFSPRGQASTAELPRAARIAVLGGGIVGLACAHFLAATGVDGVLVLERGELLREASSGNGGGLWPTQQTLSRQVVGRGAGDPFYQLGRASLELIAAFAAEADRDLEFRRSGVLSLARSDAEAVAARALVGHTPKAGHTPKVGHTPEAGRARAAGLTVAWLSAGEVLALEPGLDPEFVRGGAWHPEDAHVNPVKLGAAFSRSALAAGARVATSCAVTGLDNQGATTRVFTTRGEVEVERVLVTAGAWAGDFSDFLGVAVPIVPARGHLMALAADRGGPRHPVMAGYGVIPTASGRVLCGGTVEFVGYDDALDTTLCSDVRRHAGSLFPALRDAPVTHTWSRFRPHTPDELPLIGFCGPGNRHLIAAGHFKNGLLLSAVTGRIVAALITRGETDYPLAALAPDRFTP